MVYTHIYTSVSGFTFVNFFGVGGGAEGAQLIGVTLFLHQWTFPLSSFVYYTSRAAQNRTVDRPVVAERVNSIQLHTTPVSNAAPHLVTSHPATQVPEQKKITLKMFHCQVGGGLAAYFYRQEVQTELVSTLNTTFTQGWSVLDIFQMCCGSESETCWAVSLRIFPERLLCQCVAITVQCYCNMFQILI